MADTAETFVPHVGWLRHEANDDVARYLREGWFEYVEQAFLWLYARPGDVVVDLGAHVGLFSLTAARAMGNRGIVVAVEPNPRSASLLEANLKQNGITCSKLVEAAAASSEGSAVLHVGSAEKAPYTSLRLPIEGGRDLQVRTLTLDGLLAELRLGRVDFLKLDVEGCELDVWRGCAGSASAGQLPLVMVEFTEANQRAIGGSTADLVAAWEANGYRFHAFDPESLQLVPKQFTGPVEYANYFAVRDLDVIHDRILGAPAENRRIAEEILTRGRTAFALLKRACDAENGVEVQTASLAEAMRRADETQRALETLQAKLRWSSGLKRILQKLHLLRDRA